MPASCNVANKAIEAPTGADGVRPCACTTGGITHPQHRRRNNHKPAGCMARLYRRRLEGTRVHTAAFGEPK